MDATIIWPALNTFVHQHTDNSENVLIYCCHKGMVGHIMYHCWRQKRPRWMTEQTVSCQMYSGDGFSKFVYRNTYPRNAIKSIVECRYLPKTGVVDLPSFNFHTRKHTNVILLVEFPANRKWLADVIEPLKPMKNCSIMFMESDGSFLTASCCCNLFEPFKRCFRFICNYLFK